MPDCSRSCIEAQRLIEHHSYDAMALVSVFGEAKKFDSRG